MATKRFIGEWTDKDGKRQQTTFHVGNYGGGNLEETAKLIRELNPAIGEDLTLSKSETVKEKRQGKDFSTGQERDVVLSTAEILKGPDGE